MNPRGFVSIFQSQFLLVILGLLLTSPLSAQEKPEEPQAEKPAEKQTEQKAEQKTEEQKETPKGKQKQPPRQGKKRRPQQEASKEDEASAETPVQEAEESEAKGDPKEDQTGERLDKIETKLDQLAESMESFLKQAASEGKKPAPSQDRPSASMQRPAAAGGERPSGERPSGRPGGRPGSGRPGGPRGQRGDSKPVTLTMKSEWLDSMPWRSLGPANMAGRVTDLAVHPQDSSLWWIATGGGGLLRTNNRGTTVEHQFDQESTVSIGAIATDPRNKDILWVGTGEINPRNSVSYGNGVYRSEDGGKTYAHMGLEDTYQISRILVHPKDSDTVFIGAAGRLYGTNEERGVYKTTDGGKTWEQVLYLDERTGVIDMIMHPKDPDTLIVAMWDRLRDEFDSWPGSVEKPEGIDGYDPIRKWGPKAGLYKTTDGGDNWIKLSQGLPSGMTGRIGLDWQTGSSNTIYAIIDCEDIGKGPTPFACYLGIVGKDVAGKIEVTQVMPGSPADEDGVKVGDVLVSADETTLYKFDELLEMLRKKEAGERIELTLARGDEELTIAPKLATRPGSRTSAAQPYYGVIGEDQGGRVVLTQVTEGSPAEKAGLKVEDVILSFNGAEPENYAKWIETTAELAIGDTVKLLVERAGEELELSVALGKKPGTGPASSAFMGIQGQPQASGGARLSRVTPDGPSEKAGLKSNDIVTKVGDKEIKTYDELIAEIRARKPEDEMPVEVKRGDETLKFVVVLGDRNAGSGDRPYSYSYFGQQPNAQDQQGVDGHEYGGVYKSTDAGDTWTRVNSLNTRPMYFSVIRVDPSDDQRVYVLGVSQFQSDNGGQTFTSDLGRGVHADAHDMWIDPKDGRHMIIGCDGGFYVTYDRGQNWDHVNTAALGQFYHVAISPTKPYWVYGGLQDNGSWGGPAIGLSGTVVNEDWISVGGGDGFVCRVDNEDPDVVYFESQNGAIRRRNFRTGGGASIRPRPAEGQEFRFNWKTPFLLSNHNSKVFYSAGNYVFRSYDRGDNLKTISPEVTRTPRGSATALNESPLDPDVLYVGTDDGALWVTKDGGENWEDITKNLGVDPMWVSTVEPSRFERGRVYVCLDGHRSDNDDPHIFVSQDYGATFTSLSKDLPRGSSRCLREDVKKGNVLYLGTEFAFWVSVDAGQTWAQFNQDLPSVAIHEVAQHPDVQEIVLATHGRSLWSCDVTALRGLDTKAMKEKASLLAPADVIRWRRDARRGGTNRRYASDNPGRDAHLWYTLPKDAEKVTVQVEDVAGTTYAELNGDTSPGLHRVSWNLVRSGGRGRFQPAPTGSYRVTLVVDDQEPVTQILTIKQDPTLTPGSIAEEQFAEEFDEEEEGASTLEGID